MARNVTITVPEELYKRIQVVRDRIRVSGVCQDALESVVHIEELKMSAEKNEDLINRLKAEKEEYEKQYAELGKRDAAHDVKSMSYNEFKEIEGTYLESYVGQHEFILDCIYKTDVWDNWLSDKIKDLSKEDSSFAEDVYLEGWADAVTDFFDGIKDQL